MEVTYTKKVHGKPQEFNMQIIKHKDYFEINCLAESKEQMGFITFGIKQNNKYAWLYKIETNKKFFNQGVASAVLDVAEYIIIKNGIKRIEGVFFPSNDAARPFYEKNGFFVPNKTKSWDSYDPFWIISKDLNAQAIQQKVGPNLMPCQGSSLTPQY